MEKTYEYRYLEHKFLLTFEKDRPISIQGVLASYLNPIDYLKV